MILVQQNPPEHLVVANWFLNLFTSKLLCAECRVFGVVGGRKQHNMVSIDYNTIMLESAIIVAYENSSPLPLSEPRPPPLKGLKPISSLLAPHTVAALRTLQVIICAWVNVVSSPFFLAKMAFPMLALCIYNMHIASTGKRGWYTGKQSGIWCKMCHMGRLVPTPPQRGGGSNALGGG